MQYEDTMRSPPPVLPSGKEDSPDYKPSWLERGGPDASIKLRAAAFGVMVFGVSLLVWGLIAAQQGLSGWQGLVVTLVGAAASAYGTYWFAMKLGNAGGAVAQLVTLPSGDSTPYEQQFSYQEALVARGDVSGALESYEAIISEQPVAIAPRMRAAEHYARANRNPHRAAELFKEIRDMAGVPVRDAVYASSRLVDLYEGALADPGRAIVEMRRIIERYPGTAIARSARGALPEMKARLEASRPDGR